MADLSSIGDLLAGIGSGVGGVGGLGVDIANSVMQYNFNKQQQSREDNAYQRSVQDMIQAGINPAMASGTSGSSSSANLGAGVGDSMSQMANLLTGITSGITDAIKAVADIKNTNQDTIAKQKQNLGYGDLSPQVTESLQSSFIGTSEAESLCHKLGLSFNAVSGMASKDSSSTSENRISYYMIWSAWKEVNPSGTYSEFYQAVDTPNSLLEPYSPDSGLSRAEQVSSMGLYGEASGHAKVDLSKMRESDIVSRKYSNDPKDDYVVLTLKSGRQIKVPLVNKSYDWEHAVYVS